MLTSRRLGVSQLIAAQIFVIVFLGIPHGHVDGYDLYEGSPCKLTNGIPGVCTLINECKSIYQGLITNSIPYAEVAENRCGFHNKIEIVCCTDRPEIPTGRTTPRVPLTARSEIPVKQFSGRGSSDGDNEWTSVSRPKVETTKLNDENMGEKHSLSGQNGKDGILSSRFFLGNLLSSQNSGNTFQNTQYQQQPVRCINNAPSTTTTPPVQIRPRLFGLLNFNRADQTTTPRPSVLSPVLNILRPLKEVPVNFISSITNRRNEINLQGQFNINSGQPAFGSELCVDENFAMPGAQDPNNFVPSNGNQPMMPNNFVPSNGNQPMMPNNFVPSNGNQPMMPAQHPIYNQNIWSNQFMPQNPMNTPIMPMQNSNSWSSQNTFTSGQFIPFNSMNQPMIPLQNQNQNPNAWNNQNSLVSGQFISPSSENNNQPVTPVRNQNQNIWNIPSPVISSPYNPSIPSNANQPVPSIQNPNHVQNNWNVPNSNPVVTFVPSNSLNGNQPLPTFQPVPTHSQNTNHNVQNNPNSAISQRPTEKSFQTTSLKSIEENNHNWSTDGNSDLESLMVDNFKTTTVAPKTLTTNTPNVSTSQFEPWMLEALKESNETTPILQDSQNPKSSTIQPIGHSIGKSGSQKSEPLQMPPSSEYDSWMLEALEKASSSTQAPVNPDRLKKDTPVMPTIESVENTTQTNYGDSILDPWMKEALLSQNTVTTTTTVKPAKNDGQNPDFDPWMLDALKETSSSSISQDDVNRPKKEFSGPNGQLNISIGTTTTTKSIFGDSILDPWMKDALLSEDESKSTTTSTLKPSESFRLEEMIPPSIGDTSDEGNNKNTALDPWMADALERASSTKSTVDTKLETTSFPPSDSENTVLDPWMKEALATTNSSSPDRGSKNAEMQSLKRAVESGRDNNDQNRVRANHSDKPKSSFRNFSTPVAFTNEEWIWDQKGKNNNKDSLQTSDKSIDDAVNFWMNEALKQTPKPLDDNKPWKPHEDFQGSTNSIESPIRPNSNSQNKQLGSQNLGVGKPVQPRNGTDRINFDLFNEIFDIPENRPTKPIGSRSSGGADEACAKVRQDFGVGVSYNILGGTAVRPGEFPHMVALGYPSTAANKLFEWNCGGTLISDRYVLTAAHCLTRTGPTVARMGTVLLESDEPTKVKAEDYTIEEPIKYPSYTNAMQYNDIALLRLSRKVNFVEDMRPACLNTDRTPVAPNLEVIITGWGTTSLQNRSRSTVLLKANITMVSLNSCNQSHADYGRNRKLPYGLQDSQLCAFDEDLVKDACEGDSGGPLQTVDDTGIATILGITSFGVSCASKIPGVYANVASYIDWIESIVWP